jgi:hypothetical protein
MNTTENTKLSLEQKKQRLEELEKERKDLMEDVQSDRVAYKALVEERIPLVVMKLIALEAKLTESKKEVFESLKDIVELKSAVYGVKDGQQSHTFRSGDFVVEIGFRLNDAWDDTASAGIAKVNNVIRDFVKDAESKLLVDTIMKLLKRDKKGNLNASRVLELKQMADEFNNIELSDGVDIIMKSHSSSRSNWFVAAEQPCPTHGTKSIGLSISTVPFPEGFTFDFMSNVLESTHAE